ncbi:MAG: A24 family peptidase [Sandaracinobacteroides sp.]
MTFALVCIAAAGLALLVSCVCDLRRFEIPDTLSVVILAAAVGFGFATPGFEWLWHAGGLLVMFGIGLALFAAGWMGGGDIKLLVATAAWTGLKGLPGYLVGVCLAGGVLAIILLVSRAGFRTAGFEPERMPGPLQPGAPMPYALAIAGGAFWWVTTVRPFG